MTREEKKALKREKYRDAPALVRAWHFWLKYVLLVLVVIAMLGAGFVYLSYRYVMNEVRKLEATLHFAQVGDLVSFSTRDLDGKEIGSDELFAGHDLTVLNVWATWCGPCKNELPELGKMAKDFEQKNVQLVGLCLDGDEEAETAKQLLADAGCDYCCVMAPENMLDILPTTAVPTTYFFDSTGHMVGEPVVGAYVDQYPKRVDDLLSSAT